MTDETIRSATIQECLFADIPQKSQNSDYCILKETYTRNPRKLHACSPRIMLSAFSGK